MADHTHIEWTDATWNVVTGCQLVSPGCTNCYAMKLAGTRLQHHPSRQGLTTATKAGPVWNGQVRFNAGWLDQPLRWARPRRIFVCAHGDLFADGVTDAMLDKVFAVMALAPQHTFQVLTKRPARMRAYVEAFTAGERQVLGEANAILEAMGKPFLTLDQLLGEGPGAVEIATLSNVWLGVSVEDQVRADERIPELLRTPAAKRFVSIEPLLGPVDLTDVANNGDAYYNALRGHPADQAIDGEACPPLDWVIVGGESGPGARPMHPDWARRIRDDCAAAGVAFFFKQWGEWRGVELPGDPLYGDKAEIENSVVMNPRDLGLLTPDGERYVQAYDPPIVLPPRTVTIVDIGKKAAGRHLDGVLHNAMPEPA